MFENPIFRWWMESLESRQLYSVSVDPLSTTDADSAPVCTSPESPASPAVPPAAPPIVAAPHYGIFSTIPLLSTDDTAETDAGISDPTHHSSDSAFATEWCLDQWPVVTVDAGEAP